MQSTKINLNGVGIYVSGLPVYSIKPSDLSSCLKSCTSSACVFLSLVIQCQSQLITFSRRPPPSTLQLEGFIVYTHLFPPFFIISFFKIKFFGVPDKERSESNFSPSAKKNWTDRPTEAANTQRQHDDSFCHSERGWTQASIYTQSASALVKLIGPKWVCHGKWTTVSTRGNNFVKILKSWSVYIFLLDTFSCRTLSADPRNTMSSR